MAALSTNSTIGITAFTPNVQHAVDVDTRVDAATPLLLSSARVRPPRRPPLTPACGWNMNARGGRCTVQLLELILWSGLDHVRAVLQARTWAEDSNDAARSALSGGHVLRSTGRSRGGS